MTKRLGVMGGMFDPVHLGHLQAAVTAMQSLHLESIRLIPCYQPNHRDPAICSPSQRLEMLHLATAGMSGIIIDDREIRRGGVSYTVDTLTALHEEFANAVFVFVLGIDSFLSITDWYRWERLFELCHFLVLGRPGYQVNPETEIGRQFRDRRVNNPQDLFKNISGGVLLVSDMNVGLSSSAVREKIRIGESIRGMVPQVIESYLVEHNLYRIMHSTNSSTGN
ncbi:MAG: nicotinate-nucleotide adenylyltransferase [Pseudohongiellaceae bacterium]